jgi:quinol monooxygenase YgiN
MFRGFVGCGTALVTPFRKDLSLDEETMRRLVRRQIAAGINFLVPCGTTGESPTLTHEEHLRVVAITLEAKPGEEDTVATILDVMAAPTMAEPGVKLFLPYRSPTNPALFFVFELYVDEAGWGAHETTAHFKEAVAGLLPRVTRRERVPFVPFTPLSTSARSSARPAG